MDRPSRRGSSNSHSGTNGAAKDANSSSSRRRRREAESVASVSDGADTDSSSVGVDRPKPTSSRTNKPRTADKSKPKHASREEDEEETIHAREEEEEEEEEDDEEEDLHHHQPEQDPTTAGEEENGEEEEEEEDVEEEEPQSTGYATRARRERSQSVVSTTSDTSSIVSELPEDPLRPEVHVEKLQELEKKKKMVEEGTLAEFCRRVAEFKEERNRLLQTAEWHKNLQLKNTQDLYGFEVQRAHNIWQENKDKVKDAMLVKADALLAQLKKELEVLTTTGTLPTHVVAEPKLIVPVQPPTAPANTGQQPVKRRKVAAPMPENVMRLPLDSIASDLADIMQTREEASAKIHGNLDTPRLELSVDRRRLVCGKYVFEEGDEVVVTAVVLKQDHIGVISSVSDNEIYVVLTTGQKVRVPVDHIAHRRCEIRPFLRGSAGIESLQSSGWVECEPF